MSLVLKCPEVPEHNHLFPGVWPPLVVLQADVAVLLKWVESPCDGGAQVSQRPVQVMVEQAGGRFK